MLASDVLDQARLVLNDPSDVRWTDAELLGWLGDGERVIAQAHPRLASVSASVQLAASAVRQTIPSAGFAVLDVEQNLGSDGSTEGEHIRQTDFETLLAFAPGSYSTAGATTVLHWAPDPYENPVNFLVYPRTPATPAVYVRLTYAKLPVTPGSLGATLTLDERSRAALIDYVVARALSKDTQESDDPRAGQHFASFQAAVENLG